jgi:hypothetical protein
LRPNKHNRQELGGDQAGKRQCAHEVFHWLTSECVTAGAINRIFVTERPRRQRLELAIWRPQHPREFDAFGQLVTTPLAQRTAHLIAAPQQGDAQAFCFQWA